MRNRYVMLMLMIFLPSCGAAGFGRLTKVDVFRKSEDVKSGGRRIQKKTEDIGDSGLDTTIPVQGAIEYWGLSVFQENGVSISKASGFWNSRINDINGMRIEFQMIDL